MSIPKVTVIELITNKRDEICLELEFFKDILPRLITGYNIVVNDVTYTLSSVLPKFTILENQLDVMKELVTSFDEEDKQTGLSGRDLIMGKYHEMHLEFEFFAKLMPSLTSDNILIINPDKDETYTLSNTMTKLAVWWNQLDVMKELITRINDECLSK